MFENLPISEMDGKEYNKQKFDRISFVYLIIRVYKVYALHIISSVK